MSHANLSRRAILAGAASTPALALLTGAAIAAVPVAASLPDPIFAAIERARTAAAICDAVAVDESAASEIDAVVDEYRTARSALAGTIATTQDGLLAFTAFIREAQADLHGAGPYFDEAEDAEAFAISLDTAVRRLGRS